MGRARGEIGAPARSIGGGLFTGLVHKIANKLPPNERVKPKPDPRIARGASALKLKRLDLSDDQVIEARRAFEAAEKTCKQLAADYGVSYGRMYAIVTYQTRNYGMP